LVVVQSTEFSLKCVFVDAGESLDIDGGMLREPFGFSNINFPAQSAKLGCEGNNNDQGTRLRGLGKCQNKDWALLRSSAEINSPPPPGVASILAKSRLPRFALLGGYEQWFGICGYGKRYVFSEFDLSQKDVESVACFHPQTRKNFFSPFESIGGNARPE
jgi:hypothetical protein